MKQNWLTIVGVIVIGGVAALVASQSFNKSDLGPGFTSGNGRIEATEIDVASKLAGRIAEILVKEGDFVTTGQVLARMDTQVLEAQLAQAKAEVRKSENSKLTAAAVVAQRESEKQTAEAVVSQREAELVALEKQFKRVDSLVQSNVSTEQELDDTRAAMESGRAALAAAKSQVLSAQAGIEAAKSHVIEAESAIEAAQASVARIQADIEDCVLKAPRDGRVQYLISQVGEVLSAGGRVLNMIDLNDVYMTFFLPATQAGRVQLGQEVRLILDAAPQYVIPSEVSYVSSVAQFTPKMVETASEREKLMFRIKARIAPELLQKHIHRIKTGVPGMAYLQLDPNTVWPSRLEYKAIPE